MTRSQVVIGLDVGTTAAKASVFALDGSVRFTEQLRWRETKTTPSRARAPDGPLANPLMRNPTAYLKMRVLDRVQ